MIEFSESTSPLLISIPHSGTEIPAELMAGMTYAAATRADTDWYVDRLYMFAEQLNISIVQSTISRYVIDLNRARDNETLYPGQFTTGLCPETTFTGDALYRQGRIPDSDEIADRIDNYWQPYHARLTHEISRIKAIHGHVILLDAHSIASQVPPLFSGTLPDLNIGTNSGKSCAESLLSALDIDTITNYSYVVDGRFKGGYITRAYGDPLQNIHAIQLEISQACYMNEEKSSWNQVKARKLTEFLQQFCQELITWQPDNQRPDSGKVI